LLKYHGVAVVPGQFSGFAPIGAEQTATGYEVAWKATGANQYSIWKTDSNGNYVSDMGALTGTSIALEAAEVRFQQDLNGDHLIGIAATTIEAFGSTKLDLAGSAYTLDPVAGGAGPTLKAQGVAFVPGHIPGFNPIGAEKTATGYEVAWKATGVDQYSIWTTDGNGNYISDGGGVSGTSLALEAAEVRFHQDLNGDGRIGIAPTTIEAFGSTKLDLAGAAYSLDPVAGGAGPTLKAQGVAFVPGQIPGFNPIGAEKTATGYEVAWKVTGVDRYSIWTTDGNGNYISDGGALSGTSTTLETAETRFHQDLNGDGVIGVPTAHAAVSMPAASALAGDSFDFRPDLGTNSTMASANFIAPGSQSASSGPLSEFFSGPAAASEMLIQHVNDSHDLFVSQDQPSPLLHVMDLHAGAVFIP
jgi:serralysin